MTFIQDWLPILNIVLLLLAFFGGAMAWRRGYRQESSAIQEATINALREEVDSLRRKVDDLEKERATQDQVIATIRYLLKQYGLRIVIAGDVVTVNDSTGKSKITRIKKMAAGAEADEEDDTTV